MKIENMDFDNKMMRRNWREQRRAERRKWREERHGRWEGKNYMSEKWHERNQSGSSGVWTGILLVLIGTDYFLVNNHTNLMGMDVELASSFNCHGPVYRHTTQF